MCRTVFVAIAGSFFAVAGVSAYAADTLYNSLGPGDTHGPVAYTIPHPVYDFAKGGYDYPAHAFQFIPSASGVVSDVDFLVQTKYQGTIVGNIGVFTDADNSIGEFLGLLGYQALVSESYPLKPNTPLFVSASAFFPLPPRLNAGEKYWIWFSGYNSQFGGGLDLFGNSAFDMTSTATIEDTQFLQLSGVAYASGIQAAFRIHGTVVPEPATGVLITIALSGLFLRKRNTGRTRFWTPFFAHPAYTLETERLGASMAVG